MVTAAFAKAPVANPDGSTGISLHLEDDEVMPDQKWIGRLLSNGQPDPTDPYNVDPFLWFKAVKQNGINGVGGFGTVAERANPLSLAAKALVYHYAIFADQFALARSDSPGISLTTSGLAEFGGNDLIVALGGWGESRDTTENEAGTFMHELGHNLGLDHGGGDDVNLKPNYQSVMNYEFQVPATWMYEDTNHDGIQDGNEKDINGNGNFGDSTWSLNYSTQLLDPVDENNLDETKSVGGIPGDWEIVRPNKTIVLTSGPADWNGNGMIDTSTITSGIDLNKDKALTVINGYNDWANLKYYFRESYDAANGMPSPDDYDGLTLEQWEEINAGGLGPGLLEFQTTMVDVSEGDGDAVITVIRGGGTDGTVSVNYSTADGTASSESDYTATSGTLTFADGEYIKTITVPITDDFYAENDESFHLTLSNPTGGAELLTDSSATVNIHDNDVSNTYVVTNINDSGPGSLRQAILDANSHFGADLINFNIGAGGVQTIVPLSTLPTITDPVTIDGTTQPGYAGKPIIELDGASAPGDGLTVFTYNTTIRGLVINRFAGSGINATGLQGGSINFNNLPPVSVTVVGDYIGTDVTGLLARPNGTGIVLGGLGGFGFVVGGTSATDRNVISGNSGNGIFLTGGGIGFSIEGNYIGIGADGVTPLANLNDGVYINTGGYLGRNPQNVVVGGPDAIDGNVIADNALDGIEFRTMEQFLSNSIFGNGALGIGNFYQNVLNDSGVHDGVNDQQNYPVLSSAISSNGHTVISGSLTSMPDQNYIVQFFSNPTVSPGGYGQGRTYLGSTSVTTDDNGNVNFTATLNVAVANGQLITSTATGAVTSGFSVRVAVGDVLGNLYIVNTTDDTDDDATNPAHMTLRDAIFDANNHPGLDTIQFNIPGGGVQTISPLTPLPAIIDSVIIDATTQPGYAGTPLIQLSGAKIEHTDISGSPLFLTGIYLNINGNTVRGFDINSFLKPLVNGISAAAPPW